MGWPKKTISSAVMNQIMTLTVTGLSGAWWNVAALKLTRSVDCQPIKKVRLSQFMPLVLKLTSLCGELLHTTLVIVAVCVFCKSTSSHRKECVAVG